MPGNYNFVNLLGVTNHDSILANNLKAKVGL